MMTDSFWDYLRFEKNYSKKTIVSYGIDLTKFEEYFKGKDEKVDFTTVDADLVRGWVMNLMENGYTSASVNRKLSSLRSFYRFLLKKGVIEEDPMLKIIGPKNKKPLPVFLKERKAILKFPEHKSKPVQNADTQKAADTGIEKG